MTEPLSPSDEATGKGAVESSKPTQAPGERPQNSTLSGQLGHRDQDHFLKENDAGLPEPDADAEHSG